MRVKYFFIGLVFLLSVSVAAQQSVRLPGGVMRLDTLLNRVSRQTHQHFSLNTKKVVPASTVNWKAGNYTLEQFLQKLCATYSITYNRSGQHIILRELPKKPANPTITSPKKTATPTTAVKTKPVSKPTAPVAKNTKPVKPQEVPAIKPANITGLSSEPVAMVPEKKDTIIAATPPEIKPAEDSLVKKNLPVATAPDTTVAPAEPPATAAAKTRGRSHEWRRLFVQAGVAADDLFYTGPGLKGGFHIAYSILSWNSNFNIAGFRYGGGTSLRIKDDMRICAEITFGKLARDYDTAGQERSVKTRLTRVQVMLENKIAGHFYVQYGPVLNLLKTEYYLAGERWPLYRSEQEADQKFHYLKPVYTLRNTYQHNTPSNKKMWIGLQAGIYYRF